MGLIISWQSLNEDFSDRILLDLSKNQGGEENGYVFKGSIS